MTGVTEPQREQSVSAQISNLVVRLLHTYTGRGPTKAWTSITDELVTVLLRDQLTKGEQSLVADARAELVLEMRQAFQQTMRRELISGVERLTGRAVVAFMSADHVEPDLAIECFVLEPVCDQNPNDGSDAMNLVAEAGGEYSPEQVR